MSNDSTQNPAVLSLLDASVTQELGRRLARALCVGDVITLRGDLGTGKTTLARALVQSALAVHGIEEDVPSPTFTLVQTYETPEMVFWHVDLYRIDDPSQVRELGLDDALDDGVLLVEWPEQGGGAIEALSLDRLDIQLDIVNTGGRRARLTAHGTWRARLPEILNAMGMVE